ncbi:hypothetical protein DFS34DRAFT_189628 [Phlyctochytrium arcticum]|nr:hypothetical protein DFS34DRAFT_189628 [Phlyctochytrium arcticum]
MYLAEKIIFCVDIGEESGTETLRPGQCTRLHYIKSYIKRFVLQKSQINPKHQFGLCVAAGCTIWEKYLTSDVSTIVTAVDKIESEHYRGGWDMSTLFDAIQDGLPPLSGAAHSLRVIILYCRSNSMPEVSSEEEFSKYASNPLLFIDVVYLHDKADDSNEVQSIFDRFTALLGDSNRTFELSRQSERFDIAMTKLLAHPTQRPVEGTTTWQWHPVDK